MRHCLEDFFNLIALAMLDGVAMAIFQCPHPRLIRRLKNLGRASMYCTFSSEFWIRAQSSG